MIFDDRDQYTISLRWIVESYSQDTPDISTDQKIAIALPKIFDFNFRYIWKLIERSLKINLFAITIFTR